VHSGGALVGRAEDEEVATGSGCLKVTFVTHEEGVGLT